MTKKKENRFVYDEESEKGLKKVVKKKNKGTKKLQKDEAKFINDLFPEEKKKV